MVSIKFIAHELPSYEEPRPIPRVTSSKAGLLVFASRVRMLQRSVRPWSRVCGPGETVEPFL